MTLLTPKWSQDAPIKLNFKNSKKIIVIIKFAGENKMTEQNFSLSLQL